MPQDISVLTYAVNEARRMLDLCGTDAEAARLRPAYEAALAARRACPRYREYQRRSHAKRTAARAKEREAWRRLVIAAGNSPAQLKKERYERLKSERRKSERREQRKLAHRSLAAEQREHLRAMRMEASARRLAEKRRLGLT